MNTQTIRFDTDGWHAIMDDAVTVPNVTRIAQAFVRYFALHCSGNTHTIAIGYDGRRNSRQYASLVAEILASHGYDVRLSSNIIPTPILSYAVKHEGCGAGIMITAGAHPHQYTGIKFRASDGGPFTSGELKKIEEQMRADVESVDPDAPLMCPEVESVQLGSARIRACDFVPAYVEQLKRLVDFSALKEFAESASNHAAVMIDSMGGAGGTLLEDLLAECGWRAQTLFGTPDAEFFGRLPEPVSNNLEPLHYNVEVTDALFGLATDGDAGRCGVVYDDGKLMDASELVLAVARHLREDKHWTGGIVATASITDSLLLIAEHWGIPLYATDNGFAGITEIMHARDCMVGGDGEGGLAYKSHIPDRDAILTGLFLAEIIAKSGKSLRAIVAGMRA